MPDEFIPNHPDDPPWVDRQAEWEWIKWEAEQREKRQQQRPAEEAEDE